MIKPQRTWSHHSGCSFSKRKCVGLSPSSTHTRWTREYRKDVCTFTMTSLSCSEETWRFVSEKEKNSAMPTRMFLSLCSTYTRSRSLCTWPSAKRNDFIQEAVEKQKKNLRPSARWFASNSNRKALNERRERESLWMHVCTLSEWMRNWSTK